MKHSLKTFGFEYNAVIDDKLAIVIQLYPGVTPEEALQQVKENVGAQLAALAKYEGTVLAQMQDAVGPINAVMKDVIVTEE